MGAVILDDAEIGADSIIGAGAVITQSARIPERSLVIGTPGKVVRTLSDEEVDSIAQSARNYMGYVKNYREG
jgi:carbonic anhydrase/acetyltransferase-like protein (isoleucine patch superfamily)